MREYELVNPSDKVLFDAESPEVAALAALLVGEGLYGAKDIETDEDVGGMYAFSGRDPDPPHRAIYGRGVGDALTALAPAVVAACHSCRYVDERSSMNRIVDYAHSMKLRAEPEEEAPHAE